MKVYSYQKIKINARNFSSIVSNSEKTINGIIKNVSIEIFIKCMSRMHNPVTTLYTNKTMLLWLLSSGMFLGCLSFPCLWVSVTGEVAESPFLVVLSMVYY